MSFVLADRAYVWFNVASASDSFWMVGLVPIRVGWKGVEGIDGDNDVIMAIPNYSIESLAREKESFVIPTAF